MNPGTPSPAKPRRGTRLLDLPNELLSRIIDFLIPHHTCCPTTTPDTLRDSSIGLTCLRLFHLVKARLQNLDFVSPRQLTNISRIPFNICNNIEKLTNVASPFVEVLRLPTDYLPRETAFTTPGWCPNLRELCLPLNDDRLDEGDARRFFVAHNKLRVLTLHTPKSAVLEGLAMAPLRLRELNLISLQSSLHTLRTLDKLLQTMPSLQALTISFHSGRPKRYGPPRLRRHFKIDPPDRLCGREAYMQRLSIILLNNRHRLPALRQLSVWSGPRLKTRPCLVLTDDLARQIAHFGEYIDSVRQQAYGSPPDLKITHLRLRMEYYGAQTLHRFMRGLVDSSTEVLVKFFHMTVCYPAVVDKSYPPSPYIKELRIDYDGEENEELSDDDIMSVDEERLPLEREYSLLKRSAEFKLKSLTIDRKENTQLLTLEKYRLLVSDFLQGNSLESVRFHYKIDDVEDVKTAIKYLNLISEFAPTLKKVTLPCNMVANSEMIRADDLKELKWAGNIRVLRLFNGVYSLNASAEFCTYEEQYISNGVLDVDQSDAELFVGALGQFLEKVGQAFPRLTHVYMEPMRGRNTISHDTFRWTEDIVRQYEGRTGVDASSLRMVLATWVC